MKSPAKESVLSTVKDNVIELCRERRIYMSELADKMGITKQQLSRQLSGRFDVRISFIENLAEHLKVEPYSLLMKRKLPARGQGDLESVVRDLEKRLAQVEKKRS
jgi:transcriptional regulator with XRE-family HTH domain